MRLRPKHSECTPRYTVEAHGNGHALYFGRCQHRHGYNLAHITEASEQTLMDIERLLNAGLTGGKDE